MVEFGDHGDGLLMGGHAFVVLHAFASGGAAVTGVEAISNGVPAFRKPEWRNARQTLVVMGTGLAVMFLGLSFLASKVEVAPYEDGTPHGHRPDRRGRLRPRVLGDVLFYSLQAGTMLILVLAANTGFADFPRLASFQAGDRFLPRQLTKRGHRLVYSNGILALAGAAAVLVVAHRRRGDPPDPAVRHRGVHRVHAVAGGHDPAPPAPARAGVAQGHAVNGFGAVSVGRRADHRVTKFADGAWVILIALPVLVVLFLRLNRQYERERTALEDDVPAAATAPILRRHVVLVFVDKLDMATARAIQYARTLTPDDLRAVHFAVDPQQADELPAVAARRPVRVTARPGRLPRPAPHRAAVELVARDLADGETEVSVLLPDRKYTGSGTGSSTTAPDAIERAVSQLPHANVTTVPFHFDRRRRAPRRRHRHRAGPPPDGTDEPGAVAHGDPPPTRRHGARRSPRSAGASGSRSRAGATLRIAPPRRPPARGASSTTAPAPCRSCSTAGGRWRARARGPSGPRAPSPSTAAASPSSTPSTRCCSPAR